ncbi:MAG: hypothetical protein RH860_14580 [Cytophagales bacterium]
MKNNWINIIFLMAIGLGISSCQDFFGKKTDLGFLGEPDFQIRPVAYVPILPTIEGFGNPTDIIAGFDQLIYVVDSSSSEVIAYDFSLVEIGRRVIPGAKAIAQGRDLTLFVLGIKDTTVSNVDYRLDAIYKLNTNPNQDVSYEGLENAIIEKVIVHPFYLTSSLGKGKDLLEQVKFNDITIMANGEYYVTRNGPINDLNQFGGPDDAVLIFNRDDRFVSGINVSTTVSGNRSDFFKKPFGITNSNQPPQRIQEVQNYDFIFTSNDPNTVLKTQIIDFIATENELGYIGLNLPVGDTSRADGFLYTPDRFANPKRPVITGDGTNYLIIPDALKDSVYLFTLTGLEGVQSPPGSSSNKNINVSFGGSGSGLSEFNRPTAVAYIDKILFVADAGNGRILRFKLTTDFD